MLDFYYLIKSCETEIWIVNIFIYFVVTEHAEFMF